MTMSLIGTDEVSEKIISISLCVCLLLLNETFDEKKLVWNKCVFIKKCVESMCIKSNKMVEMKMEFAYLKYTERCIGVQCT